MSGERVAEGLARTEKELQAEKAAALVRIAGTLEGLIQELRRRREAMDALTGPARAQAQEDYARVREEARLYRWYLIIQREALGLLRHDDVDRHYRLPD